MFYISISYNKQITGKYDDSQFSATHEKNYFYSNF